MRQKFIWNIKYLYEENIETIKMAFDWSIELNPETVDYIEKAIKEDILLGKWKGFKKIISIEITNEKIYSY